MQVLLLVDTLADIHGFETLSFGHTRSLADVEFAQAIQEEVLLPASSRIELVQFSSSLFQGFLRKELLWL